MKKIYFTTVLAALILTSSAFAENIPKPTDWVNDFAGVVSSDYRNKITAVITELEQKTSAEIMVITVNSIAPYDEKSYARLIFDSWKPGKKGKDNGVLVLLAVKERLWRIEVGYGIEGILPDGRCGEIGRNYMLPYFKKGEYGEGLYRGVSRIADIIGNNSGGTQETQNVEWDTYRAVAILLLIIFFVFIPIVLANFQKRNGGSFYGGGFGGGRFGGGGGFGGGGFGGGGFGGGGGGFGGGGGAGGKF